MKYDSKKVKELARVFGVSRLTITRWANKKDPILTSDKAQNALLKLEPVVENKYHCPAALWRKFKTNEIRTIYNEVMGRTLPNQSIMSHPDAEELTTKQWDTLCHNFSCIAAWEAKQQASKRGTIMINVPKSGKPASAVKAK